MILKDFKKDMTIKKPINYNKEEFICSYNSGHCDNTSKKLWSKDKLINYGKLPNKKYMVKLENGTTVHFGDKRYQQDIGTVQESVRILI